MFYHSPLYRTIHSIVDDALKARKATKEQLAYDAMIKASQEKLAETKLVPGFTKIYA